EVEEIKHPVVREVLRMEGIKKGIELHHDADLPARAGLGSSSAFAVGLLNAMHAIKGHMVSKERLAQEAIDIERDVLKENVGSQDQVWAAHGGFNRIEFRPDDTFVVTPVVMGRERKEELNASLMLVFTGLSRFASEVAGQQIANFSS